MRFLASIILLCSISIAYTQETDSISSRLKLGDWLMKGDFEFHTRSFWMHTENKGDLLDYQTLAYGAGLGYFSPSWKGFHFGFSGFFVFQLYQENIDLADPTTQNGNRYEILLYDMNDFENSGDLDRLEELYLSYEYKKIRLVVGRQKLETPLLNEQDNRMRPNLFNAYSFYYSSNHNNLILSWITAASLRGTVDWYSVEESIGVYPFGLNPLGETSGYKDNTSSNGIGVFGYTKEIKKSNSNHEFELWNYYADNIFNLTFYQQEYSYKQFGLGLQGFYQITTGSGGNQDVALTYRMKDEQTFGIGSKAEYTYSNHNWSINQLFIGGGRFLFPREWGREQFYASLPRERFEGNGQVNVLTLKYKYDPIKKPWNIELGVAKVDLPSYDNFVLNKYGVPSFYHFMMQYDYKFKGFLEGLDIKLLAVHKLSQNPNNVPDLNRINRVDLWNYNLIVDYRF